MPDNLGALFEESITETVASEPLPDSTASLPTTPGVLTLDPSRYLLQVGDWLTLTVRVDDNADGTLEGLSLQVRLPDALVVQTTNSQQSTNWTLPEVTGDRPFTGVVTALVITGMVGDVLPVEAVLSGTGYAPRVSQVLVGIAPPNQKLTVLLPPPSDGIQAAGVQRFNATDQLVVQELSLERLQTEDSAASQAEGDSASSLSNYLYLPWVSNAEPIDKETRRQGDRETTAEYPVVVPTETAAATPQEPVGQEAISQTATGEAIGQFVSTPITISTLISEENPLTDLAGLPGVENENATLLAAWEIELASEEPDASRAKTESSPVQDGLLVHPASLLFSLKSLIAKGIDPSRLSLLTREKKGDQWEVVDAAYDPDQQLLMARVTHFSQWGLGNALATTGQLLPGTRGFTSDRSSGAASVSYSFDAPSGPGGLTPNLGIHYSSATANNLENDAGYWNYNVQADWAGGLGWGLSGLSYFSKDHSRNKLFLVLNGSSYEVVPTGDGWKTTPDAFLRIDHYDGYHWDGWKMGMDGWSVRTPDGTLYSFGYVASILDDHCCYANNGTATLRTGSKWYLTRVQDTHGNWMEYSYENEIGWVGGECIQGDGYGNTIPPGNRWYHRAVYLREVRWGGNPANGNTATLHIVLDRESRNDKYISYWDHRCLQAQYGDSRLKRVHVEVLRNTNGNWYWHKLRTYDLSYLRIWNHSLLSQIRYFGKDSYVDGWGNTQGSLLHTYSFEYGGDGNGIVLASANNGQGGRMEYGYTPYQIDCRGCPYTYWSRAVTRETLKDGIGNSYITDYVYGSPRALVDSSGYQFLGYEYARTFTYGRNNLGSLERSEEVWFHTWHNPSWWPSVNPLHGRPMRQIVRNRYDQVLQDSQSSWEAVRNDRDGQTWYWLRLNAKDEWTYGVNSDDWLQGDATHLRTEYLYEPAKQNGGQYGNLTTVRELSNGTLLRRSETEYFPNNYPWVWIINKPARVRLYDHISAGGACVSESRTIYDRGDGLFRALPTRGLVNEVAVALSSCNEADPLAHDDAAWSVQHMGYDAYGNLTVWHNVGSSADGTSYDWVNTEYDSFYHLFPVRQSKLQNGAFQETVQYYGVNGPEVNDSKAFWGQAAEHCGVNEVCTRQAYDSFARPVWRWEGVSKNSAWASTNEAMVNWSYLTAGSNNQRANNITEWRKPRGEGNFVRKFYNGLGQLVQEQRPNENWSQEVLVDYAYNAAGQLTHTSVPRQEGRYAGWPNDLLRTANWSVGYSETRYDALGRTRQTLAPNGEQANYNYSGRTASIIAVGRYGEPSKVLQWTENDALGHLARLRSYQWLNNTWTVEGEINLTHDAKGNLTRVTHPTGGITTLGYDLAGRKTSMSDPDLGNWSYAYNRHDQLTRQTDARGWTTCLYYENILGRLAGKYLQANNPTCTARSDYHTSYLYDNYWNFPQSRGQLNHIRTSDWHYAKDLTYHANGLLASENVYISGASQWYQTEYYYDAHLRPYASKYPDGERVRVGYNSTGQPSYACTANSYLSNGEYACDGSARLVDAVRYDEAGRLTAIQYPAGGNLTRRNYYFGWTQSPWGIDGNANGRLWHSKLSTAWGDGDRLYLDYRYDNHGNIQYYYDNSRWNGFEYDAQNRLTEGYRWVNWNAWQGWHTVSNDGRSYRYDAAGRLTHFEGSGYNSYRGHGIANKDNWQQRYYAVSSHHLALDR